MASRLARRGPPPVVQERSTSSAAPVREATELVAVLTVLGTRSCFQGASQAWSLCARTVSAAATTTLSRAFGARPADIALEASALRQRVGSSALASFFGEGGHLSKLKRLLLLTGRLSASVILACLLYMLPLWGSTSKTELYLLPTEMGAEAIAEIAVGQWAASLQADFIAVDAELEIVIPSSRFNTERLEGVVRVDFELGALRIKRPLVLPTLTPSARYARELLLALPMALGLFFDEHVVRLPLGIGLTPEELGSDSVSVSFATLRLSPALLVRRAQLTLQPRPAGPLGGALSCFAGFVPLFAAAIYLGFFHAPEPAVGRDVRNDVSLSVVEVQMMAKALARSADGQRPGGIVAAHFSATLAAFEAEDRRLHAGKLRGQVPIEKLMDITAEVGHEWQDGGFEFAEVGRIVASTLALPPSDGGIVSEGGQLHYQLWIAVAIVAQLCGGDFPRYATWVAQHHCAGDRDRSAGQGQKR